MQNETALMNFRISPQLKEQFEDACSDIRSNMTAEMNRMVRDFVKRHQEYDHDLAVMLSNANRYDDL